ncbi:hypothetical protein LZ518_08440 [Sphingomonas sp. RB56-2]|uniref:Uncharacterized protein n=1 Tax=Sphingomonas brevis TaxID=2908206 RepID=A0ABT0SAH0_9SPHN|nr:hypothetical protein [Sphingomonas brevis]MCL6741157.1 hypothetical protein [Sphingomonas brevis]
MSDAAQTAKAVERAREIAAEASREFDSARADWLAARGEVREVAAGIQANDLAERVLLFVQRKFANGFDFSTQQATTASLDADFAEASDPTDVAVAIAFTAGLVALSRPEGLALAISDAAKARAAMLPTGDYAERIERAARQRMSEAGQFRRNAAKLLRTVEAYAAKGGGPAAE